MAKYISSKQMLFFYKTVLSAYDKKLRPYVKKHFEDDLVKEALLRRQCLDKISSSNSILHQLSKDLYDNVNIANQKVYLLDKPFRLFVIGGGNTGKSTVINTLAGEKIAEMGILPKTWRLDTYIGTDDKDNAVADFRYTDGHVEQLSKETAEKKIEAEDANAKELDERIQKSLRALRGNSDLNEKQREQEKKKILSEYDTQNSLKEVIWPVPHNEFLQQFTLVDTPGMNQTLYNSQIKKDAYHYYQEANGIIWIIPTDKLSDKQTNEDITRMASVFHGKVAQTIAILNRWDKAEAHGEEKKAWAAANRLFGKYFSALYPYHAKKDWHDISTEEIVPDETQALRQEIHRRFYRKSQEMQIADVENALNKLKKDNIVLLKAYITTLKRKQQRYHMFELEWKKINNRNQNDYGEQISSLKEQQLDKIYELAKRYEDTLQSLQDSGKTKFVANNIVDYRAMRRQYDQLEKNIISHMYSITEEFFNKYLAEIKDKENYIDKSVAIMPKISLVKIISDADTYVLSEPMAFNTWGIVNLFRKLGFKKLSNKIREEYNNRLQKVKADSEQDLDKAFAAYSEKIITTMQRVFADIYCPVYVCNDIEESLDTYKKFIQNWQIKKPTLLALLQKED